MSLYGGERPEFKRTYDPRSSAIFWSTGTAWRASLAHRKPVTLEAGQVFELEDEGTRIEVIAIPLERASATRTRNSLRAPLTFACHIAHVEITRDGEAPIKISGIPGKILLSLLHHDGSASSHEVITEVWPEDASTLVSLRRRFDTGVRRLRDRLCHAMPEEDPLIKLDGAWRAAANLER